MNALPTVAQAPETCRSATLKFKPHLMDDAAAREVHRIADRLADTRESLRQAINYLNRSTYEAGGRDRQAARALVQQVWHDLAVAARALAEPAPRFRPELTNPRPVVRKRRDAEGEPEVADLRPMHLHVVGGLEAREP